jgi:hypothetical protein
MPEHSLETIDDPFIPQGLMDLFERQGGIKAVRSPDEVSRGLFALFEEQRYVFPAWARERSQKHPPHPVSEGGLLRGCHDNLLTGLVKDALKCVLNLVLFFPLLLYSKCSEIDRKSF